MNVFYTRELDNHGSSVIERVLFDENTSTLYLVFHNGTTVSRSNVTANLDTFIKAWHYSWGRAWNGSLKHVAGENLGTDVRFTKRMSMAVSDLAAEEAAADESEADDLYMVTLSAQLPREVALKVMNALLPVEKALHDNYGDFYSTISISTTPEETE